MGGERPEKAEEIVIRIHDSLNSILEECEAEGENISEKSLDKIVLSAAVKDVVKEEAYVNKIVESCETEFDREPPVAEAFVDKKTLKKTEGERREKELVREIADLKQKLERSGNPEDTDSVKVQKENVSIIIPSDRADTVRIETKDGERFVLIPLKDEEEPEIREV